MINKNKKVATEEDVFCNFNYRQLCEKDQVRFFEETYIGLVCYINKKYKSIYSEDIAIEVFLKLRKSEGIFKNRAHAINWLRKVARRDCMTHSMKENRINNCLLEMGRSQTFIQEDNTDFDEEADEEFEFLSKIEKARIDELPPLTRLVIKEAFNGISSKEIARKLDIDIKMVYYTLANGKRALRRSIRKFTSFF